MSDLAKVFHQKGEWAACRAAEAWCAGRGFSVGRMQGKDPRGILFGPYDIQKWRNLNRRERDALHGMMTGPMREGPIAVRLLPFAPGEAIASFTKDAPPELLAALEGSRP